MARLAEDELERVRAGQALAARTYADLAALTADIPAAPATAAPARPPARAPRRPLARAAVAAGICLLIAVAAIAAMWVASIADPGGPRSCLGRPADCPSGRRHMDGHRHHGVRGGHLMGSKELTRAAAAAAAPGRQETRGRAARQYRP